MSDSSTISGERWRANLSAHISHESDSAAFAWVKSDGRTVQLGVASVMETRDPNVAATNFQLLSGVLNLFHPSIESQNREYFGELVESWHEERDRTSSLTPMVVACPSYLRIIAMGRIALPLIIDQLKLEGGHPDHWHAALEAITGENPVPSECQGNLLSMAESWIKWYENYFAPCSPTSTARTFELPAPVTPITIA